MALIAKFKSLSVICQYPRVTDELLGQNAVLVFCSHAMHNCAMTARKKPETVVVSQPRTNVGYGVSMAYKSTGLHAFARR